MPTDLEYFYERKLDKTNIEDFYESLPNRLQSIFKQCNHTKIIWGNVLQGYRGPSNFCNNGSGDSEALESSNGIQEIKFWWGARKDLNAQVPIIGSLVFGVARTVQTLQGQLDWSSLYFDCKTGECLSHDKEVAASKLNEIGRQLFDKGKFSEAKEYFSNAYTHSSNKANYDVYKDYKDKAQDELDALSLNSQGDNSFNQGRYQEAHSKYQEAYNKSHVLTQYDKYSKNRDKAKAELEAINLNSQGDNLFNQSRYQEAYNKYQEAYDKSEITKEKKIYAICKDKAMAELNAIELKEMGDKEFIAGRYDSAKEKYQQACNKSSVVANKTTYANCISKAQVELDAQSAYQRGKTLFSQGQLRDALKEYQVAHSTSKIINAKSTYNNEISKVKVEISAKKLYEEGEVLYRAGNYIEAETKYNEAVDTSEVKKDYYIRTGVEKAQRELDAIVLNNQGNTLFASGNFREARDKYQQAFDMSQITKEKNIYAVNQQKAQTIMNKLSELETSWNKAWGIERDPENDRHEEVAEMFQKILSDAKDGLIIAPNEKKFKQFKDLTTLKIEGNELFNEGLESQQDGLELLQESRKLKQQQKFKLANTKFHEAEEKFSKALEKFKIGSGQDQRFTSCIELVQEQLNEVMESIRITEQHTLASGLNIDMSNSNDLETDALETNIVGEHNNYYAQI